MRESSASASCITVLTKVESLVKRGYVTDSSKRANPRIRNKKKGGGGGGGGSKKKRDK
jgi:hypothetical protein